jgi:hypothetical protein
MTTDQTGIPDNVATKMNFRTKVFDINNKYDSTNSRWTPAAGVVMLGAGLFFTAGVRNNVFPQVLVYKNGAAIAQSGAQTSTNASNSQVTVVDQANGTDYYECYAQTPASGSATVGASNFVTQFYGAAL